jgi:glycosyltransferase involved in cell wall biosynthesis
MAGAAMGGAENYFVNLALAFKRAGIEQRLAIRRHPARAAALQAAGLPPLELRFGGALDFFTRPALKRALGEYRPHLVLSWMSRASAMVPPGPYVHVGRLGGYYNLKYFRHCQHLVANTQDIARHCRDGGWPEARVHYVPNFVSWTKRAPEARARHGTPDGAPLLLALGRLHSNKGFDVLLAALAELPQAWLWLAGEGPERAALERRAAELGVAGRVVWLGWREDREALFAAADVCVVAARTEPFGNVVLDAWAGEVPLAAAAAAGPAAYVKDGESGLLAPVEDHMALARAIEKVLASPDLRRRLVAGGQAALRAEFTEAAVVARWRELFARIGGEACAA